MTFNAKDGFDLVQPIKTTLDSSEHVVHNNIDNTPGQVADGASDPTDTIQVSGSDGTNARAFKTDTSGRMVIAQDSTLDVTIGGNIGSPGTGLSSVNFPQVDAFSRQRFTEPKSIFDSKLVVDGQSHVWDESTSGTSTIVYQPLEASVLFTVADGETAIRQTFMDFNYQPGKSQQVFLTGLFTEEANVIKRVGLFNDTDGIFFEVNGTSDNYFVIEKGGVETRVAQSSWNYDSLDGLGPSGATLDMAAVQIIVLDFAWLGIGTVRVGFLIGGLVHYVHAFHHANESGETSVYMRSPNLPMRYSIQGSGGGGTMRQICCCVVSEGQTDPTTYQTYISREDDLRSTTADDVKALIAIRLQSGIAGEIAEVEKISVTSTGNEDTEWFLAYNPTLSGTTWDAQTWTAIPNTGLEYTLIDVGGNPDVSDRGSAIAGGYIGDDQNAVLEAISPSSRHLGTAIDGTRDVLCLCVYTLASGTGAYAGSMTVRTTS